MSFFKISKNKKMRFFLMSQGSFSPKIRFLGQKVSSVARRQTDRKVKMVLKIPFFKISKNKKLSFFLMSQGSFSPKIRFLAQQVCSVARRQTDRKVKMAPKNPIFQNFEKQKIAFLSHVPRILQSKNQVPRPKGVLCSSDTDRHESEYRGHPFRVSGFFKFSFNLSSRSGPIYRITIE